MALDEPKSRVQLVSITHSVRASQLMLNYGVGSLIDFPSQTLMTAAHEYWQNQVEQIHDERLEKVLHVDYFGLPKGNSGEGVSYVRFPEWYFCPKCRKFQPLKDWLKERKKTNDDLYMIKHLRCPKCGLDLVASRLITACEDGHIDDFPWVKWVHCKNLNGEPKEICNHPSLTFQTSASSSEALEGLMVTCENCGARATLKDAFDKDALEKLDKKFDGKYGFKCSGKHPWKHTRENCDKYPRALQRGSSSVYFPVTVSSLVIPPYSSLITKRIEDSKNFASWTDYIAKNRRFSTAPQNTSDFIETASKEIAIEISVPADKVQAVLERKWGEIRITEDYSTSSDSYRSEEYAALRGEVFVSTDEYGDFLREEMNIISYGIPHIRGISLIHKIREVQALIGYSRLRPLETTLEDTTSENMVYIKQPETNWYPAYEVRGEGIFIEFDEEAISNWQNSNPEIQGRVNLLNENYQKSFFGQSKPRKISAKFLLLHTISHALIKQLSFECGYSIASLKERLYCSSPTDEKQMAGILIYTASGDSEGTLGGLVRQGRSDIFPGLFKKAIESTMTCSNDPVCSLSMGQGRDSLNLSACYSCSLIPETSCEHFNVFLDRGTIVGTYENREMGFYYNQLYGGVPWRS